MNSNDTNARYKRFFFRLQLNKPLWTVKAARMAYLSQWMLPTNKYKKYLAATERDHVCCICIQYDNFRTEHTTTLVHTHTRTRMHAHKEKDVNLHILLFSCTEVPSRLTKLPSRLVSGLCLAFSFLAPRSALTVWKSSDSFAQRKVETVWPDRKALSSIRSHSTTSLNLGY